MEQPPRRPANSLRMPRRGAVARVLWCGLWCGAISAGRADNNGAPDGDGNGGDGNADRWLQVMHCSLLTHSLFSRTRWLQVKHRVDGTEQPWAGVYKKDAAKPVNMRPTWTSTAPSPKDGRTYKIYSTRNGRWGITTEDGARDGSNRNFICTPQHEGEPPDALVWGQINDGVWSHKLDCGVTRLEGHTEDCGAHGTHDGAGCVCESGWSGAVCEFAPAYELTGAPPHNPRHLFAGKIPGSQTAAVLRRLSRPCELRCVPPHLLLLRRRPGLREPLPRHAVPCESGGVVQLAGRGAALPRAVLRRLRHDCRAIHAL